MVNRNKGTRDKTSYPGSQVAGLAVALLICFALQLMFLINMVQWRSAPEVGFRVSSDLDPHTVLATTGIGHKAGLRDGDWIHSINGNTFETHSQRRALIDRVIGNSNVFEVKRDSVNVKVEVPVGQKGIRFVILRSGVFWLLGMIFTGIGIIVFFMKPFHHSSWPFLGMTVLMGITIAYYNPSSLYRPTWLAAVPYLVFNFIPATIISLAAVFPQKKEFLRNSVWRRNMPYFLSLILAAFSLFFLWGRTFATVGSQVRSVQFSYAIAALLIFLGINLHNAFKAPNRAVRYQSLLVLTGFTFAMFVPVVLNIIVFSLKVIPIPAQYYLPSISFLLLFFPLSIGYAIVKHDLFAIDVIVRRTYGYFLSTGTIIGFYAILVSGLNTVFQGSDVSQSPFFSIFFALTVVFTFRPLHERFQGLVDRVFYRQQYDYRSTIKGISETMISLFDPQQVRSTLVGTLVGEMFLENGTILQPGTDTEAFTVTCAKGEIPDSAVLDQGKSLSRLMTNRADPLFQHELELDPQFEVERDNLLESFRNLGTEVMLPMRYKDLTIGILSLGRKKSGKMFTLEDVDLLKTVVNQGAVALENARLFEENLEKGRMEEELKIAHDLQTSMLPDKAPEIEGVQIAAHSTPAQEVGGDFFDFIEMESDGSGKKVGIVVADVSGKAVSGALVMAAARSVFRVLSDGTSSVSDVMNIANSRLKRDVKKGMFTAMLYAVIDPVERHLTLANAGQTQPILLPGLSKETTFLETEGDRFPLGIVEECRYEEAFFSLGSGDTVVMYTDGVVEAMNEEGEMYGFERFEEAIKSFRDFDAGGLLDRLNSDIVHFVGNSAQHDDITMVVIKFT